MLAYLRYRLPHVADGGTWSLGVRTARGRRRPEQEVSSEPGSSNRNIPTINETPSNPGRPECPLKRGSLITAAEALRALHDVEFGRIEGVIAGGKVKRIIPSYDLRESDSES